MALPSISDATLRQQASDYQEEYKINELLGSLFGAVVQVKPRDPVQFLIDSLSFGDPKLAMQDKNGLSGYRRARLLEVFMQMDKDRSGYVDFKEIQAHSSKYGGQALTDAELREVFRDFDVSGDNQVSEEEFLVFFGRSVSHVSNEDFDIMVSEMLG